MWSLAATTSIGGSYLFTAVTWYLQGKKMSRLTQWNSVFTVFLLRGISLFFVPFPLLSLCPGPAHSTAAAGRWPPACSRVPPTQAQWNNDKHYSSNWTKSADNCFCAWTRTKRNSGSSHLHWVSHQLELPQQMKIVNIFALLDSTDLKQTRRNCYSIGEHCMKSETAFVVLGNSVFWKLVGAEDW